MNVPTILFGIWLLVVAWTMFWPDKPKKSKAADPSDDTHIMRLDGLDGTR